MPIYTPGPWAKYSLRLIAAGDPPCRKIICECFSLDQSTAEADANLRLIAAAPDLLAELENVLHQAEVNPFLCVGMLIEHHSNVRAVIARAKGEQP